MNYKERFDAIIEKYNLQHVEDLSPNTTVIEKFIDRWADSGDINYWNFEIDRFPAVWLYAINEALTLTKQEFPEFYILEIKMKNGGARIYLSGTSVEHDMEMNRFSEILFDESFVF